jgi:spermidine/putrescine transport system substrate-binding protein
MSNTRVPQGPGEGLNRAQFLRRAASAGLVGVGLPAALAACGGTSSGTSSAATSSAGGSTAAKIGGHLTYIGYPVIDVVTKEPSMQNWLKANNSSISGTVPPGADTDIIAKLEAGGTQGTSFVNWINNFYEAWLAVDLLAPLDMERIPNYANVIPQFGGPSSTPATKDAHGNTIGIPVYWNMLGITYNAAKVKKPTSFSEFLEPKWKGKFLVLDEGGGPTVPIGARMLGLDPNNLKKSQLPQVTDVLAHVVRNAKTLAKSDGDSETILASGEVLASFPGQGEQVPACAKLGLKTLQLNAAPKEGAVSWSTMWGLPKGGSNPKTASAFINETLTPEMGKAIAEAYGAVTSIKGTTKYLPAWYRDALGLGSGSEEAALEKVFANAPTFFLPAAKPTDPTMATYQEWVNAWESAKQQAGRA